MERRWGLDGVNVLLLSASVGAGHTKAAEAVGESLRELSAVENIVALDWSDKNVSFANYLTKKLYLNMLAFVPNLYDFFYKVSASNFGNALAQNLNESLMLSVMERLIGRYRPDAVVCTHPFPAGAAAAAKRRGYDFVSATVVTDYTLHKMWINRETDLFFVATEDMRDELLSCGFAADKVTACGIPVRRAFAFGAGEEPVGEGERTPQFKSAAKQALGIAANERMVLLMGGGLGLGGIESTVRQLSAAAVDGLVIFVLAGKNEKLRHRLTQYARDSRTRLEVVGFIEDTAPYMKAADLIITKPGALTLSESFALGLPQILHEPIPGPETQNAHYAVSHGAALWETKDIGETVREIFGNEAKWRAMQQAAKLLARPASAATVARKIAAAFLGKSSKNRSSQTVENGIVS